MLPLAIGGFARAAETIKFATNTTGFAWLPLYVADGAGLLEKEEAGFDVGAYRDAPPGLRLWAGATVETSDLDALFPWLDWAWASVAAELTA